MPRSFLIFLALVSLATHGFPQMNAESPKAKSVSIEGHRGARGYLPENTIPSFKLALEQGADTLEMDIVITKDKQVLLSHEPWFSAAISTGPDGKRIAKDKERDHNIFKLTYAETLGYDVGSLGNPAFPEQKAMPASKPLLAHVFAAIERFAKEKAIAPPRYNIEIKSTAEGDGVFHPAPGEFADLVVKEIERAGLTDRTIIQSFDVRPLQHIKKNFPAMQVALLVGGDEDPAKKLALLGFTPATLSPHFSLVSEKLIALCHEKGMKLVPWTVNRTEDLERMSKFDLDGIITDYPDRAVRVFRKQPTSK